MKLEIESFFVLCNKVPYEIEYHAHDSNNGDIIIKNLATMNEFIPFCSATNETWEETKSMSDDNLCNVIQFLIAGEQK